MQFRLKQLIVAAAISGFSVHVLGRSIAIRSDIERSLVIDHEACKDGLCNG